MIVYKDKEAAEAQIPVTQAGTICYVEDEMRTYVFANGRWVVDPFNPLNGPL